LIYAFSGVTNQQASLCRTVKATIQSKLVVDLNPEHIDVLNESHQHNVPENSETHFKVVCVSKRFDGLTRVKRHQSVYSVLSDELNNGVHALALHLYTPEEWARIAAAPASPDCMGGSKA